MTRFVKGVSGNPRGRKPGKPNANTLKLREATPAILDAMISAAVQGDCQAASIVLNRTLPQLKSTLPSVEIISPKKWEEMTAQQKASTLLAASIDGRLPADVCETLIRSLKGACEIGEWADLERRMAELEAAR
ncbi:DUF5681 domain-containing protein [Shewanella sp.]|uniref:DUF5681 domain-containing protein n=1 Tax=Shewanella sp. TaxID=50422 RepID=UPI003F309F43